MSRARLHYVPTLMVFIGTVGRDRGRSRGTICKQEVVIFEDFNNSLILFADILFFNFIFIVGLVFATHINIIALHFLVIY